MPTPSNWDPSSYNLSTTSGFTLGAVYEYQGREFRFVKNDATTGLVLGDLCEWAATSGYVITQARSATTLGRCPAGVAVGTISAGNYGFVCIRGICGVKSASTTAAVLQKCHGSTAGTITDASATWPEATIGVSLSATSGGFATVMVSV